MIEGTHFQPAETVFGTWPFERPRASKVAKKGERVQPVERMPNMKLPNEPTDLPKEQADRVPARSKMVIPYPPSRPAVRHFDYGTHPWNSKYWKSEDESKFPVLQGQTTRVWGDPAPKAKPRPRAEQHGGLYSRDRLSFGRPVKVDTIAERHFRRLARPDHRLGRRRWHARGPRRLEFVELINTVLEI